MRRNGLLVTTALASVLAGLGGACSIEDTPHAPTYTLDIQPLVLSRCVRCHGAGGHLNADPDIRGRSKTAGPLTATSISSTIRTAKAMRAPA